MRTMRLPSRLVVLACLAVLVLPGCDKEKPKAEQEKKADPTPVPSGLVFNDFLPQDGKGAAGLGVRDAGLEGGLAEVAGGGEPGEPGDQGDPGAGARLKVTEPGAEPRSVRKYTFAANKTDKRLLTVLSSQGSGPQTQEMTLKISLDFTPKTVKPTGAQLEAKVTKVEIPGAPPQAGPALAAMNGLAGSFEVTPRGDAGEVQFMGTPQMQNNLAQSVVGAISQATQLLMPPFPDAPIGVGAKWEVGPGGADQGAKKFTLKEVSAEGGVVELDIEIKVPKHAQRGPGGMAMLVEQDGKGKYVYQFRFDKVSTKVEGELSINQKIEVNDPRAGGKQQVAESQKIKHTLEVAK